MYRFKFLMLVCVTVCASYLYAEILGVGDITETEALEEFYTKTEGDGWTNRDNWLEGDPCLNQWYGVGRHVPLYRGPINGKDAPKFIQNGIEGE